MPTVILSPHHDDAVLSCWHVLAGPGNVRVVNVFAGIPGPSGGERGWDRAAGVADSGALMAERRAEDRAALALAGREATDLPLLAGQYRDAPPDPGEVAAALAGAIGEGALVLAPAALDDHPSHVAVRDAAVAGPHRVLLYADIPHARVEGSDPGVHVLDDAALAAKRRAIGCYRSQLELLERPPLGPLTDDLLRHERVWPV